MLSETVLTLTIQSPMVAGYIEAKSYPLTVASNRDGYLAAIDRLVDSEFGQLAKLTTSSITARSNSGRHPNEVVVRAESMGRYAELIEAIPVAKAALGWWILEAAEGAVG